VFAPLLRSKYSSQPVSSVGNVSAFGKNVRLQLPLALKNSALVLLVLLVLNYNRLLGQQPTASTS
jgi:hypothetical protein